MRYMGTLISVSDMSRSKRFYKDVLGLDIVADFGANVTLTGGVILQTVDTWESFIETDKIVLPNNACELYFEENDIDRFYEHLKKFDIYYVHELIEHSWGQRVVRFYDPDKHIIEVGENINSVVKRFLSQGMNEQEVADRMDIPLEFVKSVVKNDI